MTAHASSSPSDVRDGYQVNGRLLTAEQLSERWQVPKSHVYRLAREGRIPVVELGHYRRFRVDAIEAFELAGGVAADA
jgi:excisionase family DNA binding protein